MGFFKQDLDNSGKGNTIFTFYTTEDGVIENVSEMSAKYQITHVFGELIPIK